MTSTSIQARLWTGPALLSFGFRPFFLAGAFWAGFAMVLWIGELSGARLLQTRFDPVSWHAHSIIFGYLAAIVAGFLLTAVPNWTGRMPVVGWRLAGLVTLWIIGRAAVVFSELMPVGVAAALDLSCLVALALFIAREILAGRNWRNLIVLALLLVLIAGGVLFHLEAATGRMAAQGLGLRLGLAAGIMMISVIGGRIVPSFTRNWMVRIGNPSRPAAPMQRIDKATLAVSAVALGVWAAWPQTGVAGVLLLIMGAGQAIRLMRWAGSRTLSEPLVWVLHLAYGFIPLGALALGAAVFMPELLAATAAQHIWMVGAIGLMSLAVMTRATLGHTGRELTAGAGTAAIYGAIVVALLARVAAGMLPGLAPAFYYVSATGWCGGFFGFVLLYGPMVLRPSLRH